MRRLLVLIAVATVLADSSIVTLALPAMVERFDLDVRSVAHVLTSFNLVLGLAAVPAAIVVRRAPAAAFAVGAVAFAASSLACGLAGRYDLVIAGRVGQAIAGAVLLGAAIPLLHDAPAVGRASLVGTAVGPGLGGILTQALGWQSIFLVQAPILVVALAAARRPAATPTSNEPSSRPAWVPLMALLLVSAGLAAALFLLVLLLIEAFGLRPAAAGAVASVLPLATVASLLVRPPWRAGAAAGAVLVASGVAALGLLPEASAGWVIGPQIAVGVGLGLAVGALTARILGSRPVGLHAASAIAARHLGVVVGLVLLTPLVAADLERATDDALAAGTAVVLDSRVPPQEKIALAIDLIRQVDAARDDVPDLGPVFGDGRQGGAYDAVRGRLDDEIARAATHAFSRAFLVGGLLALLALVPLGASWAAGRE